MSETGRREECRDQRFGREHRLRSSECYARCYKEGRRVRNGLTGVFFVPSETGLRLGVTATRKLGGSVVRHRVKRWVREVFRRWPERARLPAGDLVVHLYPQAGTREFHDVKQSVEQNLARLIRSQRGRR